MAPTAPALSPAEAATRLGISIKALRVYEQRGWLSPQRSAAGWRVYGPAALARAAEIVTLRRLGLSLAQIDRVLTGAGGDLDVLLAAHHASLTAQARSLADTLARIQTLRADLAQGRIPTQADLARLAPPTQAVTAAFDLPWPWGGERFEVRGLPALTYLTGPLGSGKTRLAHCLAEALPGARFLGLNRPIGPAREAMAADPDLAARVHRALDWLTGDGATLSDALIALVTGLEAGSPAPLVVDLVEEGLDAATQDALGAYLRRRRPGSRPLIIMTRSSAILDLSDPGADSAILFCPANHSPPFYVAPHPGALGYEALASCLAPPDVRARVGRLRVKRVS